MEIERDGNNEAHHRARVRIHGTTGRPRRAAGRGSHDARCAAIRADRVDRGEASGSSEHHEVLNDDALKSADTRSCPTHGRPGMSTIYPARPSNRIQVRAFAPPRGQRDDERSSWMPCQSGVPARRTGGDLPRTESVSVVCAYRIAPHVIVQASALATRPDRSPTPRFRLRHRRRFGCRPCEPTGAPFRVSLTVSDGFDNRDRVDRPTPPDEAQSLHSGFMQIRRSRPARARTRRHALAVGIAERVTRDERGGGHERDTASRMRTSSSTFGTSVVHDAVGFSARSAATYQWP